MHRIIALEPDWRDRLLLSLIYSAGIRVSKACRLTGRNLQVRADSGQIIVSGKVLAVAQSCFRSPCTPHMHLITASPIHLIQSTLGHASVATTSQYLRAHGRKPCK